MFDNYFTLFGLPEQFAQNPDTLQTRYYSLQAKFHPDKFIGQSDAEKALAHDYSAKISDAYHTLKDPFLRAQYILQQRQQPWDENKAAQDVPMECLLEQMALRETLDTLKDKPNATQLSGWKQFKADVLTHLSELFEKLSHLDDPKSTVSDIYLVLQQIPFYQRLKNTIENVEIAE